MDGTDTRRSAAGLAMQSADAYPFPPRPAALRFALALLAVSLVWAIDATSGTLIDDGSHFLLRRLPSWRARGSREPVRRSWRR
jgi:hypothetical protein